MEHLARREGGERDRQTDRRQGGRRGRKRTRGAATSGARTGARVIVAGGGVPVVLGRDLKSGLRAHPHPHQGHALHSRAQTRRRLGSASVRLRAGPQSAWHAATAGSDGCGHCLDGKFARVGVDGDGVVGVPAVEELVEVYPRWVPKLAVGGVGLEVLAAVVLVAKEARTPAGGDAGEAAAACSVPAADADAVFGVTRLAGAATVRPSAGSRATGPLGELPAVEHGRY